MTEKGKDHSKSERETAGEAQISSSYYFGNNTFRAKNEWFSVGMSTNKYLIKAYLYIKQAYAHAHSKLEIIDPQICQAIMQASEEMRSDSNSDQFIAEPLQSISGITINTNINEVIANRAEEILGGKPREYKKVLPEQHVNLNQEVNALFFLATQLAVLLSLSRLEPEILNLERLLRRDALTLAKVLKVSASHNIQSTTGQWGKRVNVFAVELEIAIKRIRESSNALLYTENVDRDNTALSKETNTPQTIEKLMLDYLDNITDFKLKEQDWLTSNNGISEFVVSDLVFVSSALKDLATVLSKVARVVKMAHALPSTDQSPVTDQSNEQFSSKSIQIFADSLNMAAFQAVSNNLALTFLAQCEQLENGMLMPLLSKNLLNTIDLLQVIVVGFQRKGLL